jgi:hypothetical protein
MIIRRFHLNASCCSLGALLLLSSTPVAQLVRQGAISVASATPDHCQTTVYVRQQQRLSLAIDPCKPTLYVGEKLRFSAVVKGSGETRTRWSVEEQDGGSIKDDGVYTAPRVMGIYHVSATLSGISGAKAVATVTVVVYYDTPLK